MNRRGVLVTRPAADAAETAARIAALGLDPVIAPVMVLEPRRIEGPVEADAIVVASRNAIPALPPASRHLTLLAVGSATAARARAAGFGTVLDAEGDAAALAALAARSLPPGARVLLAHGAGQGEGLAAALERAGLSVTRRCAYAVQPAAAFPATAAAALRSGALRAATFLSAETARAFVGLIPPALCEATRPVEALAIGPAAAESLSSLPWRIIRVSFKPTLDEVLALL